MSGPNFGSTLIRWAQASSRICRVVLVGFGSPVLDGKVFSTSSVSVTRRKPLGVINGAFVLCGPTGRSRNNRGLLVLVLSGRLVGVERHVSDMPLKAFWWVSGVLTRAFFDGGDGGEASDRRLAFCVFSAFLFTAAFVRPTALWALVEVSRAWSFNITWSTKVLLLKVRLKDMAEFDVQRQRIYEDANHWTQTTHPVTVHTRPNRVFVREPQEHTPKKMSLHCRILR